MNFLDALKTSASGLSAQRVRMNLIANNLANVNTTKTEQGGPYKRKDAIFEAVAGQVDFHKTLAERLNPAISEVRVADIVNDSNAPIMKYDPSHPDANEKGYLALPNINVVEEMVNMISATRSYEANVTAIEATKQMASQALDIGR
ncbi:MAG: flagellar basal body rod protein FlgC [Desulfobacteraceae bacterium]|nr:flagellar basal body rod protein FlgC [Desulfobacteraceae bacterium]